MKHILRINFSGFLLFCLFLLSCTKQKDYRLSKPSSNPSYTSITPGIAPPNALVTLSGSGLGAITSIVFDSGHVNARFNPVFNTDNTIMFRVPLEALPGSQHIIFTNSDGKQIIVPFKVLGLPAIVSVSNYDFTAGSQITLTGKNLDDVSRVVLHGSSDTAIIISKASTSLVIQMPSTSLSRATLDITNTAGTITTTQEFVDIDNAYAIFSDSLSSNVQDWSWSLVNSKSSGEVKTGSYSMQAQYNGSWGGMQLHFNTVLDITPYKFVSFWIKGGAVDKTLDFYLNWSGMQKVLVPANVWTYYRFDLNLFKGAGVSSVNTWIMQIEGNPDTFYLDDIIFFQ